MPVVPALDFQENMFIKKVTDPLDNAGIALVVCDAQGRELERRVLRLLDAQALAKDILALLEKESAKE